MRYYYYSHPSSEPVIRRTNLLQSTPVLIPENHAIVLERPLVNLYQEVRLDDFILHEAKRERTLAVFKSGSFHSPLGPSPFSLFL